MATAKNHEVRTDYLDEIFKPIVFKRKIKLAASAVKKYKRSLKYQGIICTGISGVTFASALSYETGMPMLILRKPGESTHSYQKQEGALLERYLFVDDFICKGITLKRVRDFLSDNGLWDDNGQKIIRSVTAVLTYRPGGNLPISLNKLDLPLISIGARASLIGVAQRLNND